jgi:hypothetical protein
MTTMLEDRATEEQHSVVLFLWAKGLKAKDIYKEMFPVYGGKCLSRKAVHNWIEKFSQAYSKIADDAGPSAEVAEGTVRKLLCCGFRRTGKTMGQVYQCWRRICREMNVLPGTKNICFTYCIHFWPTQ